MGAVVVLLVDSERAMSVATAKRKSKKVITEREGCSVCAKVISKNPLKYEYVRKLVPLANSTINKKLKMMVCPECDAPLLANAKARAGKEIDED